MCVTSYSNTRWETRKRTERKRERHTEEFLHNLAKPTNEMQKRRKIPFPHRQHLSLLLFTFSLPPFILVAFNAFCCLFLLLFFLSVSLLKPLLLLLLLPLKQNIIFIAISGILIFSNGGKKPFLFCFLEKKMLLI